MMSNQASHVKSVAPMRANTMSTCRRRYAAQKHAAIVVKRATSKPVQTAVQRWTT